MSVRDLRAEAEAKNNREKGWGRAAKDFVFLQLSLLSMNWQALVDEMKRSDHGKVIYQSTSDATANSTATTSDTNFIKSSCSATTYPQVCIQSLSSYATSIQQSPRQLAQAALSVSLTRAQKAKTFVTKLAKFKGLKAREYGAVKDCLEEMGDTVDRLSKSVQELKNMGKSKGQDFVWHMSNVETWVSAALTDDNTCLDGFSGKALDGKIKASIRAQVLNVAQCTSNALALCNRFASKH